MTGADLLRIFGRINDEYRASTERGMTDAYLEGAQIGRLGLSHELNPHAEDSARCMDWRRGYFMALGEKVKR